MISTLYVTLTIYIFEAGTDYGCLSSNKKVKTPKNGGKTIIKRLNMSQILPLFM